jgi:membrane protease YdiL (CAAX protease family)
MEQPPLDNTPLQTPPTPPKPAAWTATDAWLGLGLLILLVAGFVLTLSRLTMTRTLGLFYLSTFEFILLIPIAVILFWRKASWAELGLRRFDRNSLFVGFGLLAVVYIITILNNILMLYLGVITQADVVFEFLGEIDSPLLFAFVTAFIAPVTEELFFRGFLFKGLREKYGWVNALMFSSIIFALFHGQVATLLPTFLLGALFAYLYQRTGSVYPGMILHFAVNSLGACVLLVSYQTGVI